MYFRACSSKNVSQNRGIPLIQFYTYFLKYNVNFNDTRSAQLENSRTAKSFLATFPLDWSPLPVQSPIGSAQVLLNHFPTRLVTSSSQVSYWFSSSAPEPLSHSAGHLFQSSLLLVQLSSKLSENP